MSELSETRWAVISERGVESDGLAHGQARDLMQRLTQEKVSGLCIVTDAAAHRFTQAVPAQSSSDQSTSDTARRSA
jgi:hypothetical protein